MKTRIALIISLFVCVTSLYGQQKKGYTDDLYSTKQKKSTSYTIPAPEPAAQTSVSTISGGQATNSGSYSLNATSSGNSYSRSQASMQQLSNDLERTELVTSYETSLERRIIAYRNYKEMDQGYWDLMDNLNRVMTGKYDQSIYNTVVVGNEMWVEPRYITSIFDGSDPAEPLRNKSLKSSKLSSSSNVTFSINLFDPWYSSWTWYNPSRFYPYRNPYWGWNSGWGPSWGWGGGWGPNWGWNSGWGPSWGWGGGYYPSYYPSHHHHYPSRPVVWGNNYGNNNHYGGGGPASSIRPNPGERPSPGGGFRPGNNGTNVTVSGGGRPGQSGVGIRPETSPGRVESGRQPSQYTGERSYRNNTPQQTPISTPSRGSSYSPSSGSSGGGGGSYGGGAGGFTPNSGGGGRSR